MVTKTYFCLHYHHIHVCTHICIFFCTLLQTGSKPVTKRLQKFVTLHFAPINLGTQYANVCTNMNMVIMKTKISLSDHIY